MGLIQTLIDAKILGLGGRGPAGEAGSPGLPYPLPLIVIVTSVALTDDDQGVIFMAAGGNTIDLPAVVTHGAYFRVITGAPVIINPGANNFANTGDATDITLPAYADVEFLGVVFMGNEVWSMAKGVTPLYDVSAIYPQGMVVRDLATGKFYMSKNTTNIGNPLNDTDYWLSLNAEATVTPTTATAGSLAIDLSLGDTFRITPDGETLYVALSGYTAGKSCTFIIEQGAVPYGIVFSGPTNIRWVNDTVYAFTNAANAVDVVTMDFYDVEDCITVVGLNCKPAGA